MQTKVCVRCNVDQSLEYFASNRRKRDGKQSMCNDCFSKERKGFGRERNRREHISKYYKLSWPAYLAMLEAQNYECAICSKRIEVYSSVDDQDSVARVDHCHSTNVVRGLLCRACNHGLGCFFDDPSRLANAIVYLKRFASKEL